MYIYIYIYIICIHTQTPASFVVLLDNSCYVSNMAMVRGYHLKS